MNYFIFNENTNWNVNTDLDENTWELDNLTKLNITISKQFRKHFVIYAGTTFNVAVSNRENSEGNLKGSLILPWTVHTITHNNKIVDFYQGFRLGVRF